MRLTLTEVIARANEGLMSEYLGADGRSWLSVSPTAIDDWTIKDLRERTWREPPAEDNLYYDTTTESIVVKLTPPVENVLIEASLINTSKLRKLRRTVK